MAESSSTGPSALDYAQKYGKMGVDYMVDVGKYVAANSDKFPEMANDAYRNAQTRAKQAYKESQTIASKAKNNPSSLTFTQIVIIAVVVVGGGALLLGQMLSLYQENLPGVLKFLLKYTVILVIPLVAASFTCLGMFLEHHHQTWPKTSEYLEQGWEMIVNSTKKAADFVKSKTA